MPIKQPIKQIKVKAICKVCGGSGYVNDEVICPNCKGSGRK